ncbi:uncharacterized protein LOC118768217 [Octopus sinensis]|uniref:Uncharacterized protein LOC118768217 n=1 Tax=Octopus sinensis TaxID=2607531 RepID=A0A7E6FTQ2_9MOLL|nr:uncharacterized protein LOC118768217 [Octopus sinensis]
MLMLKKFLHSDMPLKIKMTAPILTNEMKRHAVIVALIANHGDLEISRFLKVARSFVHKIRCELEKEDGNASPVSKRKKHSKRSDSIRTPEFIQEVKQNIRDNPGKSMRSIAKEFCVSEKTIRNICA